MTFRIYKKNAFLTYLGSLIILLAFSPISNLGMNYTISMFVLTLFWIVFFFVTQRKKAIDIVINEQYIFLYAYSIYLFALALQGKTLLMTVISSFVLSSIALIFIVIFDSYEEIGVIKRISVICIYIILINTYTIFKLIQDTDISRFLAATGKYYSIPFYEMPFVGGFAHVYSVTLLNACFLVGIRGRAGIRSINWLGFIVGIIFIIKSKYTFAFLISGLMILGTIFEVKSRKKLFFIICAGMFAAIIAYFNMHTIIVALSNIAGGQGTYVGRNILTIEEFFRGNSTFSTHDAGERYALYKSSIDVWKSSPFVGIGYLGYQSGGVGGHSVILDTLAHYGILGCGIFVFTMIGMYFSISKRLQIEMRYPYLILFLGYLTEMFVNTGYTMTQMATVFYIIPFLLSLNRDRLKSGKISIIIKKN